MVYQILETTIWNQRPNVPSKQEEILLRIWGVWLREIPMGEVLFY